MKKMNVTIGGRDGVDNARRERWKGNVIVITLILRVMLSPLGGGG